MVISIVRGHELTWIDLKKIVNNLLFSSNPKIIMSKILRLFTSYIGFMSITNLFTMAICDIFAK